jgi:hypothetical protein
MRKLILLLLFIPIITTAQIRKLKVKLIDYSKEKIPAYCGYSTELGLLKFKVIEDSAEFKKDGFLLTMFECPRERMESLGIDSFISNQKYLLTIGDKVDNDKNLRKAVEIFYKSENENLPIFWFSDLKKIK